MVAAELLNSKYTTCQVQYTEEARNILLAFRSECSDQINSTAEESWRQMWNRAHLKAEKLTALLAVADNNVSPVGSSTHVTWALSLIRKDISTMSRRITSGDVGLSDSTRELKILHILREYLAFKVPETYGIDDDMRRDGVVPRRYIQLRIARSSPFANHKLGSVAAMDQALRSLGDSGYILELDKKTCDTRWGFSGKCYRILTLPPAMVNLD